MRTTRRSLLLTLLLTALVLAAAVRGTTASPTSAQTTDTPSPTDLPHAVGQLLIGTYRGTTPSPSVLSAVRGGRVGGILLLGDNTGRGVAEVRTAVAELQTAARRGGNPGLLVMTDQEGGEVRRLPVAPVPSAASMGQTSVAHITSEGRQSGAGLRGAGVNVDLAPVADVATNANGFIAQEGRSFASNPAHAAQSACAFATGLLSAGVGATLKHFPGLGAAVDSTDDEPVSVQISAQQIQADTAAYRACGSGPRTLVMISSASYPALTGNRPAVLAPQTYAQLSTVDHAGAITISDALDTPAFRGWPHPAQTALSAGLDLLLYSKSPANAPDEEATLVAAVRAGHLSRATITRADTRVAALKQALGLG